MTAVHATAVTARATRLERMILTAAASVERAVTAHVERRVRRAGCHEAQDLMCDAHADARALGNIGMLPR